MTEPGQHDNHDIAWTVGRLLDWTTDWFKERQIEGGRLAAELLLAHALGCRKIDLYTRYEQEPAADERARFRELVKRAGGHTPVAHLLGTREFFSLEFNVTPAALIPRPETESLVQRVLDLCRQTPDRRWRILDVGTGTGCIAVAIAHYAPNTSIVATDIDTSALAVAAGNIERHSLRERVHLVEADGLALPPEVVPDGGFDLIVSNPPYIDERVWPDLPANVRDHEPRTALVPPGGDGLAFYRRFAADAPAALEPGGRLLVEIGHDQHTAVLDIFASTRVWKYAGSYRDVSDPHQRAVEFVLEHPPR